MRIIQLSLVLVSLLLVSSFAEAGKHKKRKSHSDSFPTKTKTKTKWSSSTDLGAQTQNSMVATEEHGYYVKRTFLPLAGRANATKMSPPFLAVPIAWFPCANADCVKLNSMAINSNSNSLAEGFLCDDDCTGPYEPICGKTSSEVAVFYNKCKLNVAKCRSHGYWSDFSYEECKTQYPEEVKYAELKFRANPYFKEKEMMESKPLVDLDEEKQQEVTTINPLIQDNVTEQKVLIKEIHQEQAQEKQKESKDRYEEIPKPKKDSIVMIL
uniref:Kazal-like domain-containing protein n=1 Tax=Musca domestica TaxID=7370 RepID=A0A1I8NKA5_MUSDO